MAHSFIAACHASQLPGKGEACGGCHGPSRGVGRLCPCLRDIPAASHGQEEPDHATRLLDIMIPHDT